VLGEALHLETHLPQRCQSRTNGVPLTQAKLLHLIGKPTFELKLQMADYRIAAIGEWLERKHPTTVSSPSWSLV